MSWASTATGAVASLNTFLAAFALLLLYLVGVGVWRVYFSPLAKFPGPKIAGLTNLYAFYYDIVCPGQYIWVVQEMHRKYGPIVRVRPDVLHVNDPSFINELYSQSPKKRRERHDSFADMISLEGSMLATRGHEEHRKRRAALNPFFSQQNVRKLEPVIHQSLMDLLHRMSGWAKDGSPVKILVGLRAATKDIIHSYAFGDAPTRFLEMEDCNAPFFKVLDPSAAVHLRPYARWLTDFMEAIPPVLLVKLVPRVAGFVELSKSLVTEIESIRAAKDLPEGKTIFHEMIRSDTLPESEKATKRLTDEAYVMIIAGTDTTASTLRSLIYHLLADPQLLKSLKEELATAMPDKAELPTASKTQGLPILNAVINETLRLHPGATHRQDRLAPDEDLVYTAPNGPTWVIPAGAGIGMTAPLINRHPDLYERPDDFLPERYLEDPNLLRHLFTFSKGARQCIGLNLAYQTLQIFTAGIFRKYDLYDPARKEQTGPTLELYKTTRKDIEIFGDFVTPSVRPESEDLRIVIRN